MSSFGWYMHVCAYTRYIHHTRTIKILNNKPESILGSGSVPWEHSRKQKNYCLHKYRPQLRGRASVSPHMVGDEGEGGGPRGLCKGKWQEVKRICVNYRQVFSRLQSCASKPAEWRLSVTACCLCPLLFLAPGTCPVNLSRLPSHVLKVFLQGSH